MSYAVNLFVLSVATSTLLVSSARAGGSGQEGADRFVPAFAFTTGILAQTWEAAASSRICRECSLSDPMAMPEEARPPASGDTLDVTPYVFGRLDLTTPELPIPGSPRLFFGGEFGGAFGVERKVAREGDPSSVGSPVPPGSPVNFGPPEATGQGTELVAFYGDLVYGAHAGVTLPFEFWDRQFRISPSFGWTRFEIEVEGRVVDAECGMGCNRDAGGFLRPGVISASAEETFDAIGPGIELEMETGRLGYFGTSILVGARAYKVLGDTTVDLVPASLSFNDAAGSDEYDGKFEFEVEDWLYRAMIGFRLYWLGPPR